MGDSCISLWPVGLIFLFKFLGVGHPNFNFWGVETPTTPTVAALLKTVYSSSRRRYAVKSNDVA